MSITVFDAGGRDQQLHLLGNWKELGDLCYVGDDGVGRALSREQAIELAGGILAWLCKDKLDAAAIDRGRAVVKQISRWKDMEKRNPAGFKSYLSQIAQLEESYPDLTGEIEP